MQSKFVIIGAKHQLGRSVVRVIEAVSPPPASKGYTPPRSHFRVERLDTGEQLTVRPGDLGPAGCPIEHKLRAQELAQPHYLATIPTAQQLARKKAQALAKHGQWSRPAREWAMHWLSEYSYAAPMFDHNGYAKRAIEFEHEYESLFADRCERLAMRWALEPRRFDLPHGHFQPDFELLDEGIFVEITQAFEAKKAHKLAGMRALHPGVCVAVLAGDTFHLALELPHEQLVAYLRSLACMQADRYQDAPATRNEAAQWALDEGLPLSQGRAAAGLALAS